MKKIVTLLIVYVAFLMLPPFAHAVSSTKTFSTNYTLMNFGVQPAAVSVQYLTPTGLWPGVPLQHQNFTILPNGGQQIIRQYESPLADGMARGKGSAVISSNQPLGAAIQIQARNQTPSSGAYSGITRGSMKHYVPLVASRGQSASGAVNSQIIIQNMSNSQISTEVEIISTAGTLALRKPFSIPARSSQIYDLADEGSLPINFFGSAVVKVIGSGTIGVVSNLFSGPDGLQTFNAFPQESLGTRWVAPLFTVRLSNGLSTPITVQNLSGGPLSPGSIQLNCKAGDGSSSTQPISTSNPSVVVNSGSYSFNPVTDRTAFPTDGWQGSCTINSPGGGVVAFVQMRQVGTPNAAAYEAINAAGTDKKLKVPLFAKQLSNGFATVLTVQNLNPNAPASVDFIYTRDNGVVTHINDVPIVPGGSINHSGRLTTGNQALPQLVAGWTGTVDVQSDQPVAGIVQLTIIGATVGDTFMAHNAFSLP